MIDAHQHFWSLANPFTTWPTPDLAAIYRDYAPADLAPLLAATGVRGTILVQAAPDPAETRYMLGIAQSCAFIKGVVGWVDFAAADAVAQMRELTTSPLIRGLRPMIQSIDVPGWILQRAFDPVFAAMIAAGLRFDALVRAHQITDITALAQRYPALPIVLDHGGKPAIATGRFADWAADIDALARCSNVCAKLSGLWTEAGADHSAATIRPYAAHLLQAFGPQRLMWGSDWPVLELAGGYADWLAQAGAMLADLDDTARAAVFGGNAARFYGVDGDDG